MNLCEDVRVLFVIRANRLASNYTLLLSVGNHDVAKQQIAKATKFFFGCTCQPFEQMQTSWTKQMFILLHPLYTWVEKGNRKGKLNSLNTTYSREVNTTEVLKHAA